MILEGLEGTLTNTHSSSESSAHRQSSVGSIELPEEVISLEGLKHSEAVLNPK